MQIAHNIRKILSLFRRTAPIIVTTNLIQLKMPQLLEGRCALITGGYSGIGLAIAKAMLQSGAKVVITGRDQHKLEAIRESILNEDILLKDKIEILRLDNRDVSNYKRTLDLFITKKKEFNIDILVNNAGINGGCFGFVSSDEFDNIISTNLKSAFFLAQYFSQLWIEKNIKGNILNISSSSSVRPATSAYALSKWGLNGLTVGLAKKLTKYGITVNAIAPGPTSTPMLIHNGGCDNYNLSSSPIGRYIMPEEIANMTVILTSEMGRTIVGTTIFMTGGAGVITVDDIEY